MEREQIDLKSVKKLNNSGKPARKSGGSWISGKPKPGGKPGSGKAGAGKSGAGKAGSGKPGAKQSGTKFADGKTAVKKSGAKFGTGKTSGKANMSSGSRSAQGKPLERSPRKVPEEWLYLSEEADALLRVKSVCADACGFDVEYWAELGVIEVIVDEHVSLDFEEIEIDGAEDDNLEDYCRNHNIKMAAAISVRSDDYKKLCDVMREIQSSAGGFFCQDNGRYVRV